VKEFFFLTRQAWRKWLISNHNTSNGIWLIYYKKHTKKQSIIYTEALEEALCFGWIDSKIKRIDDEQYKQIFTPRKRISKWSEKNKQLAEKLIKEERMTEAGFEKIEQAKKNGTWKVNNHKINLDLPEEVAIALKENKIAFNNFSKFTITQQSRYIHYILEAKQSETRLKRTKQVIQLAEQNIKPSINAFKKLKK